MHPSVGQSATHAQGIFEGNCLHRYRVGGKVPSVTPRKKTNIRLSEEAKNRIPKIKKAIGTSIQNAAINYAILNVPLPTDVAE